jgi:hypothetical protein
VWEWEKKKSFFAHRSAAKESAPKLSALDNSPFFSMKLSVMPFFSAARARCQRYRKKPIN